MQRQVDRSEKAYTGWYGIVILLDERLTDATFELARRYTLEAAFSVKLPHLSLYHAELRHVPIGVVKERMENIHGLLGQMHLTFRHLTSYRDYLFWELDRLSPDLREAHKEALKLSAYHPEGKLKKQNPPNREELNIAKHGHALVDELYRPHLTLGATAGGFSSAIDMDVEISGKVAKICFCEMEPPWGSIKRIALCKNFT